MQTVRASFEVGSAPGVVASLNTLSDVSARLLAVAQELDGRLYSITRGEPKADQALKEVKAAASCEMAERVGSIEETVRATEDVLSSILRRLEI